MKEYQLITEYYGTTTTNRSGVQLINHIDEGLKVLSIIEASDIAKKAYCLHPIVQSDECLSKNYDFNFKQLDSKVLIAAIEYRSVANEYLSNKQLNSIDDIRLSPLKDVNDMLIADKIQNRKDFEIYHKQTHPRSAQLYQYFKNWLQKLNVTESFYQKTIAILKKEEK